MNINKQSKRVNKYSTAYVQCICAEEEEYAGFAA